MCGVQYDGNVGAEWGWVLKKQRDREIDRERWGEGGRFWVRV